MNHADKVTQEDVAKARRERLKDTMSHADKSTSPAVRNRTMLPPVNGADMDARFDVERFTLSRVRDFSDAHTILVHDALGRATAGV